MGGCIFWRSTFLIFLQISLPAPCKKLFNNFSIFLMNPRVFQFCFAHFSPSFSTPGQPEAEHRRTECWSRTFPPSNRRPTRIGHQFCWLQPPGAPLGGGGFLRSVVFFLLFTPPCPFAMCWSLPANQCALCLRRPAARRHCKFRCPPTPLWPFGEIFLAIKNAIIRDISSKTNFGSST